MVAITIRNAAALAAGAVWNPMAETGMKARMDAFVKKYGQFSKFTLQNIGGELYKIAYDGDGERIRFCAGDANVSDDSEYFSNLLLTNMDGAVETAINELILTIDRPFDTEKAILNELQKRG